MTIDSIWFEQHSRKTSSYQFGGFFDSRIKLSGVLEQVGELVKRKFPWHYIIQVENRLDSRDYKAMLHEKMTQEYIERKLTKFFKNHAGLVKIWCEQKRNCFEYHWYLTKEINEISQLGEFILEDLNDARGLNFKSNLDTEWRDLLTPIRNQGLQNKA